jgi:PAS domain S-box-containing protein
MKILAIDDNPNDLIMLKAAVGDALPGTEILTASSGAQGIALARAEDPDVVLLDILMPGMDGFSVCRKLKEDERLQSIPVVFLTGLITDRESRIQALEAGAEGFLSKPLDEVELVAQLRVMARIKAANRLQRLEKDQLAELVAERTQELEKELASHRQVEEALRESSQFNRQVIDSAHEGVIVYGTDLRYQIWNPFMEKLTGFKASQVLGKHPLEVFPFLKEVGVIERLEKALAGEIPEPVEFPFDIGGKTGWTLDTSTPFRNATGAIIGVIATVQDVTERRRAEKALRDSEFFFKESQRVGFIGSYKTDFATGIWESSEVLDQIFGIDKTYVRSVSGWLDITHPEDRQMMDRYLREEVIAKRRPFNKEYRIIRKCDGAVRWVNGLGEISFDREGKIVSMIGTIRDITERKLAEEALRQSEDRFRAFYDLGLVGVAVTSPDKGWLQMNDRLCQMLEYRKDELCAVTWAEITHPDDLAADEAQFQRLLVGEVEGYELEKRFITRSGGILPTYLVVRCLRKPDRSVDYVVAMVQDITERKRAEDALRMSEEKYRSLNNSMTEGMALHELVCDAAGKPVDYVLLDVNPAFETMTGLGREAVLGRRASEVYRGEAPFLEAYAEVATTGRPVKFEKAYEPMNKTFAISVFSLAKGRFATVFSDITERKHAQEDRDKLQAELSQAQKMESVGRLAGGVAHDFNNMLTVIQGNAAMVLEDLPPDSPYRENLAEIEKCAKRSADLTRQLLAFARKQTVSPKVLDLNETLESMLKMLRRLIGEDIDLVWHPSTGLWPIKADPSQIDQVLANLCVNARDAIGGVGKITIQTENVTIDQAYCDTRVGIEPGEYVALALSDDGCGMDKEVLAHLFEPFFTTKEMGKGTGLGLATVYGIVKQNQGFMDVQSEPGRGTTFKVHVPRHAEKTPKIHKEGPVASAARGHETILLVEDEPLILKIGSRVLESLGYTVLTASTPGEAVRLAREHAGEIHLLVTDVIMPEMNGRDLAKNLLSLYPGLKRLFMSGYTADVIAHHGVLEEGIHFLQKPFTREVLAEKVRQALTP